MASTIWQEAKEKHQAAAAALHAHLDKCAECDMEHGAFCDAARTLLEACLRAPKFPVGLDVIRAGQCPMNAASGMGCTFCSYGHMTECHYPHDCQQAQCGHLAKYHE